VAALHVYATPITRAGRRTALPDAHLACPAGWLKDGRWPGGQKAVLSGSWDKAVARASSAQASPIFKPAAGGQAQGVCVGSYL
jgi:hypothetical protein